MSVRFREIALRGFESYRDEQRISLEDHVTLLAGRNNVGKSALLRALARVSGNHQSYPADSALESGFRLTVTIEVDRETLVKRTHEALAPELQRRPSHSLSAVFAPGHGGQPSHIERLELLELEWVSEGPPERSPGWTRGGIENAATGVGEFQDLMRELVGRVRYLAPARIEQGPQSLRAEEELTSEGRNLTAVMFQGRGGNPRRMQRIDAFMKACFPEIETITVAAAPDQPASPTGEPMVYYEGRDAPVPLRSCGTGVEAMLRFAVEIVDRRRPQLFLIDEPQAYLHPHAERQFLSLIEANADHQYLIATHSHVLLNSRPLSNARLITLDNGASRVTTPGEVNQVLDEIGLTGVALGLAERVVWVEGPSEEAALEVLLETAPEVAVRSGVTIKHMPLGVSHFNRADRRGRNAHQMCAEIVKAVLPTGLEMTFLFDRDERTPDDVVAIREASGGRAVFTPGRELENLFLTIELLEPFLRELALAAERKPPTGDEIRAELERLTHDTGNDRLYAAQPMPGVDPLQVVKGSALLDQLTWHFAVTEYDKTLHGRRLAQLAVERAPQTLNPLLSVLGDLGEDWQAQWNERSAHASHVAESDQGAASS